MKRLVLFLLMVLVAAGVYAQPWKARVETIATKRLPNSVTNDIVLAATINSAWSGQAGADSLYWAPGATYDKLIYNIASAAGDDSSIIMLYRNSTKVATYRIMPSFTLAGTAAVQGPTYIWGPTFDAVKIFRWDPVNSSGYITAVKTD